jgi:hypothetical protein
MELELRKMFRIFFPGLGKFRNWQSQQERDRENLFPRLLPWFVAVVQVRNAIGNIGNHYRCFLEN